MTRSSQQDKRLRSGDDAEGNSAKQELMDVVAKHKAALEEMQIQGFSTTHLKDTKETKISSRIAERPLVAAMQEDQLVARMLKATSRSASNAFIAVGAKAMDGRVALRAEFERLMVICDEGGARKSAARAPRRS